MLEYGNRFHSVHAFFLDDSNIPKEVCTGFRGSSHDVTKIQTKKLSILLSFYFHEVLQHLKTFIYTNLRYERVLRFATENA